MSATGCDAFDPVRLDETEPVDSLVLTGALDGFAGDQDQHANDGHARDWCALR